jgi:hypothetical protein
MSITLQPSLNASQGQYQFISHDEGMAWLALNMWNEWESKSVLWIKPSI